MLLSAARGLYGGGAAPSGHPRGPTARSLAAEFAGTAALVALAAGAVVADARHGGALGPAFVALLPALGAGAGVYAFGRASGAHLNPAVSLGLWAMGRAGARTAALYAAAQCAGALLAALFVLAAVGPEADLGANAPGPHPVPVLLAAEAALAASLMLAVAASLKTDRFGGALVGAAVGLCVFFFGDYSGASLNPARSLGPALASGAAEHLWMYLLAPPAGACAAALALRLGGNVNSLRSRARGR